MKKLFILFILTILASCGVRNYYQVYKVNPEAGTLSNKNIVFEDKNCIISYDLWAVGGNIGFEIYNKTDNDLIIDLTKTFFVLNGIATEYYQKRTFTKSIGYGSGTSSSTTYNYWNKSTTGTNSSSFSTSYNEKSELAIPSKTKIYISEYKITDSRYLNCNMKELPSKRDNAVLKFEKNNSPFIFYNIITYYVNGEVNRFENKFHVTEIGNYRASDLKIMIDTTPCGRRLEYPKEVFKNATPDKFYLKYTNKEYIEY